MRASSSNEEGAYDEIVWDGEDVRIVEGWRGVEVQGGVTDIPFTYVGGWFEESPEIVFEVRTSRDSLESLAEESIQIKPETSPSALAYDVTISDGEVVCTSNQPHNCALEQRYASFGFTVEAPLLDGDIGLLPNNTATHGLLLRMRVSKDGDSTLDFRFGARLDENGEVLTEPIRFERIEGVEYALLEIVDGKARVPWEYVEPLEGESTYTLDAAVVSESALETVLERVSGTFSVDTPANRYAIEFRNRSIPNPLYAENDWQEVQGWCQTYELDVRIRTLEGIPPEEPFDLPYVVEFEGGEGNSELHTASVHAVGPNDDALWTSLGVFDAQDFSANHPSVRGIRIAYNGNPENGDNRNLVPGVLAENVVEQNAGVQGVQTKFWLFDGNTEVSGGDVDTSETIEVKAALVDNFGCPLPDGAHAKFSVTPPPDAPENWDTFRLTNPQNGSDIGPGTQLPLEEENLNDEENKRPFVYGHLMPTVSGPFTVSASVFMPGNVVRDDWQPAALDLVAQNADEWPVNLRLTYEGVNENRGLVSLGNEDGSDVPVGMLVELSDHAGLPVSGWEIRASIGGEELPLDLTSVEALNPVPILSRVYGLDVPVDVCASQNNTTFCTTGLVDIYPQHVLTEVSAFNPVEHFTNGPSVVRVGSDGRRGVRICFVDQDNIELGSLELGVMPPERSLFIQAAESNEINIITVNEDGEAQAIRNEAVVHAEFDNGEYCARFGVSFLNGADGQELELTISEVYDQSNIHSTFTPRVGVLGGRSLSVVFSDDVEQIRVGGVVQFPPQGSASVLGVLDPDQVDLHFGLAIYRKDDSGCIDIGDPVGDVLEYSASEHLSGNAFSIAWGAPESELMYQLLPFGEHCVCSVYSDGADAFGDPVVCNEFRFVPATNRLVVRNPEVTYAELELEGLRVSGSWNINDYLDLNDLRFSVSSGVCSESLSHLNDPFANTWPNSFTPEEIGSIKSFQDIRLRLDDFTGNISLFAEGQDYCLCLGTSELDSEVVSGACETIRIFDTFGFEVDPSVFQSGEAVGAFTADSGGATVGHVGDNLQFGITDFIDGSCDVENMRLSDTFPGFVGGVTLDNLPVSVDTFGAEEATPGPKCICVAEGGIEPLYISPFCAFIEFIGIEVSHQNRPLSDPWFDLSIKGSLGVEGEVGGVEVVLVEFDEDSETCLTDNPDAEFERVGLRADAFFARSSFDVGLEDLLSNAPTEEATWCVCMVRDGEGFVAELCEEITFLELPAEQACMRVLSSPGSDLGSYHVPTQEDVEFVIAFSQECLGGNLEPALFTLRTESEASGVTLVSSQFENGSVVIEFTYTAPSNPDTDRIEIVYDGSVWAEFHIMVQ